MVDRDTLFRELNEGIIKERCRSFRINLNKNLQFIRRYGGLGRIIPGFTDKMVIVAGAGSSLEKSYSPLKKYQFRKEIEIIATDMALLPLVRNGIYPRFVISCETTPVDFFRKVPTENIHLLAFSCISNINLREWEGDVSFYNWMIHNPYYDELWEMAGRDLGFVATGNLVTTQAISFAMGCRIRSLFLIGNDLGFTDKYYARGTVRYDRKFNVIDRWNTIDTEEYNTVRRVREYIIRRNDRLYYSNNQFLAGKLWLEELFQKQGIPVYDSSEPGCSEEYVEKMGVDEYFDQFERKKGRKRRK
jgi:hypothetical protein